jgi:hypothetical protein
MRSLVLASVAVALAACPHRLERKTGASLDAVDRKAPFLKIHMRDGDLYVLSSWRVDERERRVVGAGKQFGADRRLVGAAAYSVPLDGVALFETNTIVDSPSVASMALITGASIVVSAACIAAAKACFGSCPTFYARADDGRRVLQAEGFSDAISPSLEHHDIDALARTTGRGGRLTIDMTNEAYETHVVKQVDLLAVPRPHGGRVFATREELWSADSVAAPLSCDDARGSCADAVHALDGRERTSLVDDRDLAARETIDLAFAPVAGRAGIVIGARQSLVTTFLLYQGLAYLGETAGEWFAALERGNPVAERGGHALERLIGGIEVQVERDGAWQTVGEVFETGPIATDVHLLLLPDGANGERVRLRLPKGGWRIDYVALARITGRATPIRLAPTAIRGTLGREFAGTRTPATAFPIVAQPGDAYELAYELPPGDDYELFLDSRGYYLEWMRQDWLRGGNPLAALRMLVDPSGALRDLAPAYKRIEPEAEALFWRSRYARP